MVTGIRKLSDIEKLSLLEAIVSGLDPEIDQVRGDGAQTLGGLQSRQGADGLLRVRNGKIPLVVKITFLGLPAWLCSQCGEPFFEAREVDLIQKALGDLDRESAALAGAGSSVSRS